MKNTNENIDYELVGRNIRSFRKSLGLTQENVADYLGLSPAMINYYENGKREIDIIKLMKLSDLFIVELSDLLDDNPGVININQAVAFKRDKLKEKDLKAIARFRKIIKNYNMLSR